MLRRSLFCTALLLTLAFLAAPSVHAQTAYADGGLYSDAYTGTVTTWKFRVVSRATLLKGIVSGTLSYAAVNGDKFSGIMQKMTLTKMPDGTSVASTKTPGWVTFASGARTPVYLYVTFTQTPGTVPDTVTMQYQDYFTGKWTNLGVQAVARGTLYIAP